jgi:phosphotransferase system HPr (HPr) family protein
MRTDEMEIRNPSGLHARPAALFVKTASGFASSIRLENVTTGSPAVDAKSILGVMSSGAARGHRIRVTTDGPDEEAALDTIRDLVAARIGEEVDG